MSRYRLLMPVVAAILIAAVWVWGGGRSGELVLQGATMGTHYTVVLPQAPPAAERERIRRALEAELDRLVAVFSTYVPDSEISRFNRRRGTDWVSVSPPMVEVFAHAEAVYAASGGAFDISVGPLVDLWGFGAQPSPQAIPSAEAVAAAAARIGQPKLAYRREPPAVRKSQSDMRIDASALAKGYAVDRLVSRLRDMGYVHVLVEIGGEVRTLGYNRHRQPWRIAIERPDSPRQTAFAQLGVTDAAVATSGDYRNRVELGGRTFGHIVDPRSGWPVSHALASVSVVADEAVVADAWATALYVLGPEEGFETARRLGLAAFFITRSDAGFDTRATPAMARWMVPPAER